LSAIDSPPLPVSMLAVTSYGFDTFKHTTALVTMTTGSLKKKVILLRSNISSESGNRCVGNIHLICLSSTSGLSVIGLQTFMT
jgi:hypothetical protein